MSIAEAARLAEAGIELARTSTVVDCVRLLVQHAQELPAVQDAGFAASAARTDLTLGALPSTAVVQPDGSRAGDVLAADPPWIGVVVRGGAGGSGGDGQLWVRCEHDRADVTAAAQVLARQASLALDLVEQRAELEQRHRTQHALVEAGKVLSQEMSLDALLLRIVEIATDLVGARYGALGVLDDDGEHLARFITTGMDDATRERIGELPRGRGLLGVLIHEPAPLRLRTLADDPRSSGFPPHHPPMSTFLGVPILARSAVKGRLYLTEKLGGGEFTEEDEQVAMTLASQAAIAIENTSLYEQLLAADTHKSAFLASMSHELRTPLNSILGYAQLLLGAPEALDEEQLEDVRAIHASGTHLLGLIQDLLDLSRVEAGKLSLVLEQVDVAALVRDVAASMRPQLQDAGTVLDLDVPPSLLATCDRTRVRQMLLNVVGNATKFTRGGRIDVSLLAEGDRYRTVVADTGPGIPPDDLARIFESFFQSTAALARTPRVSEGAGLGLSITRSLAELHGGEVSITSELGAGTAVTIDLPLAGPAARPSGPAEEP